MAWPWIVVILLAVVVLVGALWLSRETEMAVLSDVDYLPPPPY
jgi:short subunit fatty acids transporter